MLIFVVKKLLIYLVNLKLLWRKPWRHHPAQFSSHVIAGRSIMLLNITCANLTLACRFKACCTCRVWCCHP